MKILIAEDDLVTREMLKRVLRHMADEIIEAGDGRETLEKLESEDPDILFTDLQLPDLEGHALIAAVRASPTRGRIPVVCMSVVREKDEVTRVLALGVQDYVLKPIRAAEVHERFRDVIAKHAGWRDGNAAAGSATALGGVAAG
jgi:DNA-binding response OmpR family regulator